MSAIYRRIRESRDALLTHLPAITDPTQRREAQRDIERYDRDLAELDIAALNVGPSTRGAETSEPGFGRRHTSGNPHRDAALRSIDALAQRMPAAACEASVRMIEHDDDPQSRTARYVTITSQRSYFRAFAKWFNDPTSGHLTWTDEERHAFADVQREVRTLGIGASGGGFLTPFELDPNILVANVGSVDPMRQLARIETTAVNEKQFVTSLGVVASWDAESAEVSDDTPTLLGPSITCFKGQAFVPVSFELFEDSDIAVQMGTLLADAKVQLEASTFTLGTGIGQARGVITGVAAVAGSVVTSAGSALAIADVVANQNALPARWRARAAWQANLSIINQGRLLPAYTNGPPIVNDATTPPRMLGWALHENSSMDGVIAAGTTNDYVLLSGDFASGYIIVDRLGSTIELVPHLFGANRRPTGERGFLLHWRTGGDVVIADAFRLTNYSG